MKYLKLINSVAANLVVCVGAHASTLPAYHSISRGSAGNSSSTETFTQTFIGGPASGAASFSIPSGLTGLGQPSHYNAQSSSIAAPSGGPLSGNVPFVFASASADFSLNSNSLAALTVHFSIDGPANTLVPLNIEYIFRAVAGNFFNGQILYSTAEANAKYEIYAGLPNSNNFVAFASYSCGIGYSTACRDDFYEVSKISGNFISNTNYQIGLLVSAETASRATSGLGINYAFSSAYLDPYLSIDSSFSNASMYTISLSSGIANTPLPPIPAIPEPNSFLMLGIGVTLLFANKGKRRPQS